MMPQSKNHFRNYLGAKRAFKLTSFRYVNLTNEQEMVYGLIDDAGAEGIWSKTIKTRLNMHDTTMRTALKHLEAKRLITDMKSVEHLNRKMYIKASLTPSEKATGGAWYTDGELDEGMLNSLTGVLYAYIHSKSFYWSRSSAESSARPAKRVKTGSGLAKAPTTAEAKSLRDAALKSSGPHVKEEDTGRFPWTVSFDNMLPFPAGYQGYPTIGDITTLIEKEGISPTTLTKEDVEQLLEVLCFDDKIEKIKCGNGEAYRALRKSNTEVNELKGPMNGLTEAPCGRCPVFDLCEEGGTVSPSNCEYFTTWLGLDGW